MCAHMITDEVVIMATLRMPSVEHRQRIINHRFAVDGQKLLVDAQRQRGQFCPRIDSQRNIFSRNYIILWSPLMTRRLQRTENISLVRFCSMSRPDHSWFLSSPVVGLDPAKVIAALNILYRRPVVKMS